MCNFQAKKCAVFRRKNQLLLEPHVEEILALINDPENPLKP